MSQSPTRAPLFGAVCVVFLGGCARAPQTATDAAPPPAPRDTAVTAEDIVRTPGEPIERILMRRFPGVSVSRTSDGGISVLIRGVSSFYSSNEPLYVLDGVPIQPGRNGTLTGINPYDIESIEVLKNPADIAIYGIRGANGVIVIKTKRPGQ